jgi:hypothetical protein
MAAADEEIRKSLPKAETEAFDALVAKYLAALREQNIDEIRRIRPEGATVPRGPRVQEGR